MILRDRLRQFLGQGCPLKKELILYFFAAALGFFASALGIRAQTVSTFAGNAQHTANYAPAAQNLNAIRWSTSIDLNNTGAFIHYGAPVISAANTVFVPVKTATDGYQVSAFNGGTGAALYTLSSDYILPSHTWIPTYNPALAIRPAGTRLYYAGAGGTIYYVDSPDTAPGGGAVVQQAFYGLSNYQGNSAAFNSSVFINTPITSDSNGNVFFGFRVQGTAPSPLSTTQSGFARIDASGTATYVLAGTAAGDGAIGRDTHNSAPALSNDQSTLYVLVKAAGSDSYGYLLGLNSTTLATKNKVLLKDPRNGNANFATILEESTASPMVAPDNDVYIGVFSNPDNGSRGFMLRFSSDLSVEKAPGAFGWDYTPGIVPSSMVPSYSGASSYLILSKYNNYAGTGDGDGVNKVALLDPNATQIDPHPSASGLIEMREVLTVIGPTPDGENLSPTFPNAVREWCIDTPAINPATHSIFMPSEDGHVYRWDLNTNSLSQALTLSPGIGEPYVPTVIGPDGTVYTLNGGTLFALGNLTGVGIGLASSAPDVRAYVAGQSLTFTATVTNTGAPGPTPTGSVTFQDTSFTGTTPVVTALATGVLLDGSGHASVTTSSLAAGGHFITANYSGGSGFSAGSSTMAEMVHAGASATTLGSSGSPSNPGQSVTFTATVVPSPAGPGTPTGMVAFQEGSIVLAQVPLSGGAAGFSTSALSAGSHSVTAYYYSDSIFAGSSGNVVQNVTGNSPPTATAVSITGTLTVGQVLTGHYTYGDVDGDAQGVSTFRWLRDGSAIGGATAITYTVAAPDAGHSIVFEVTPVAATGTSPGTPAQSSGVSIAASIAGSLVGAGDSNKTAVNLTQEGGFDWVHWGDASLDRKASVAAQISDYTIVGSGTATKYSNDARPVNWTGGTPTGTSTNNFNGVYVSGTGKGFSITAPADTTNRTLIVHAGGWNSGGTLTAHLSDTSASDFVNTTATASGSYDRNYVLTYNAASSGKTLTVTWKMATGSGNVTLSGAALGLTVTITATGGATQSTSINSAFPTPFQVTVKDGSNNPISGAPVTFAAPGSGASGIFSSSATVTTNVTGVATAPAFTANGTAGTYTVAASTAGVGATASFNLTNLAGPAASVTATGGTPQAAQVATAFANPLVATVKDSGGNAVSGATVHFAAPGSGARGTFAGGFATADVMTIANGTAASPVFTANGTPGSYLVTASVAGVVPTAGFSLTNSALPVGGSLSGIADYATSPANLTTEGVSDWIHWGDSSLNRKATGGSQLSSYTVIGSFAPIGYNNDPRPLNWTDGAPSGAGTNNFNGVYVHGAGNGFSFTAPADLTLRTLVVHMGGYFASLKLTAHLSDGSAADFVDTTTAISDLFDRNYVLTYRAGSTGQTLKVTVVVVTDLGAGNISINAAALSNFSGTITATAGNPQSTTVGTAFGTPLQVTVKDVNNSPVNGATVTFTAPGSGPKASFGSVATATAVTDSNGVASAPTLTANTITGVFYVAATVPGVPNNTTFSLTNAAGTPVSITATGGTPRNAVVNTNFTTTMQALVLDGNSNPVSGATVTFTAPASGPSGAFTGMTSTTVTTNAAGAAFGPTFTANSQPGSYVVTASVAPVVATANFNLTNTAGGNGSLAGSGNSSTAPVNLTTEGNVDWIHWGDVSLNRKASGGSQISDFTYTFTPVGTESVNPGVHPFNMGVENYSGDARLISWNDGSPLASSTNNSNGHFIDYGTFVASGRSGFSFTAPADGTVRTLIVHLGGQSGTASFGSGATLTAHLSDASAPDFVDITPPVLGVYDRNYTLTYHAGSPGQTLIVTWVISSGRGNVNLNAASLSAATSTITATAGTPQSATVSTAFSTALRASLKDSGNNPMSGVTVTFTAPGSGPSAAFSGSGTTTAVTDLNGVATAPALTANGQTGIYAITASAPGTPGTASFVLTNTAAAGGGSLAGLGTSSSAAVDISVEGTADWAHWGDGSLNRKAGGGSQISTYTIVGSGTPLQYSNDPRPLSWSGGTPTATSSNNFNGLYISGVGKGFSITAPADTTSRTIVLHIGGWFSGGTLTAHLSDSSASDFVDTTASAAGPYDRNYTITYRSAVPGTLILQWVMASTNGNVAGNVTLNGAALSSAGAITATSIATNGGTPQSITIGTAFATALKAIVKDASNNPVNGASVTFTAPASGASGTFSGSGTTATVSTDVTGVATAPAFTANMTAGSYSVGASTPGVVATATFSLTNQAGSPASVTATGGTGQSATISTAFTNPLIATVKDSGGNLLSGVTVTFTAPGSGASGTFPGSVSTASAMSIANGTATSPTFAANATTGGYAVTASVSGATSANFNLTNNPVAVTGSLSGVGDSNKTGANLTTEGASDWVHWGDASLNRKTGVAAQISDFALVGGGAATKYTNDPRPLNWTDGTPAASGTNDPNGFYNSGVGKGFSITAPADTTTRTLVVHLGGWNSGGTLTAHLSNGSATDFVDTTASASGQYDRNYTLTYQAGASGQTLTVTWKMSSGSGNVTLSAAALH